MRYLVLLSLAALASSAPVGEKETPVSQVGNDDIRIKRAKEIMMGDDSTDNQQTKEKRSDPSVSDIGGFVKAEGPAVDIPEKGEAKDQEEPVVGEASIEEAGNEDSLPVEQEMVQEVQEEPIVEEQENTDEMSDESPVESVEPADDSSALVETGDESDSNGVDSYDDDDEGYIRDYLNSMGYMQKSGNGYVPYWSPLNPFRSGTYRRRRNSPFPAVHKRSRRIKRDLWDDLAEEYEPYEKEENVYDTYSPEELELLLDILDNARAYEEQAEEEEMESPWENESDLDPYLYEGQPGYFVPAKRQAGLTVVPGVKRNSYFYPFSREPESHFGAFIPEKRDMRDYGSEYERLMQLAAALRDQEEYEPYDLQGYEYIYRKK